MKKFFSLVLCFLLLTAMCNVSAEELCGGWNYTEINETVPQEAADALAGADNYADYEADITPKALLGTQVVAGVNYMLLCTLNYHDTSKVMDYAILNVYADLNGNSTITWSSSSDLNYVAEDWEEYETGYAIDGYELEYSNEDKILTVRLLTDESTGENWELYLSDEKILEEIISGVEGDVFAASFWAPEDFTPGVAVITITSEHKESDGEPTVSFFMAVDVNEDATLNDTSVTYSNYSVYSE